MGAISIIGVKITKGEAIIPFLEFQSTKSGAEFMIDLEEEEYFTMTLGMFLEVGLENNTFAENLESLKTQYRQGLDEVFLLQTVMEILELEPSQSNSETHRDDHNWKLQFDKGTESYKKIKELYESLI